MDKNTIIYIENLDTLDNNEIILTVCDKSEIHNIWNTSDENLKELNKIEYCRNISTWSEIDQDLYRLILLSVLINKEKETDLIKFILNLMVYYIEHTIKFTVSYIKIIKYGDDIKLEYNITASTAHDMIDKNKKRKPNLSLVIDNE